VDIAVGVIDGEPPIAAEPFITPRRHTVVQLRTELRRLARVLP
jgi:hypothetical protein